MAILIISFYFISLWNFIKINSSERKILYLCNNCFHLQYTSIQCTKSYFKRNNWIWLYIFKTFQFRIVINIITLSLSWCPGHLSIKQYDISLSRIFIRYCIANDLYKTIKGTQEFWGFPKHKIHITGNQRNTFEKWEEAPKCDRAHMN